MDKYKFNSWLNNKCEWADYGFEPPKNDKPQESGLSFKPLQVGYIIERLRSQSLGQKQAVENNFYGEARWGEDVGAVKVVFTPPGGIRAVVRKLAVDLQGDDRWVCKKVVEVKNAYDRHPDALVLDLTQKLEEVDSEGIDSPSASYDGLERLVLNLASFLRRNTTQKILMYQGIRRVMENKEYIIHWGCTGMGVQRMDQKRLDSYQIHCTYDKAGGFIKITGTELGDSIAQHRWIYDPSEFIEFFMPSQSEEEIQEAILTHLNCY